MPYEQQVAVPGEARYADSGLEDLDEIAGRYAREREGAGPAQARRLRDDMIRAAMPMAARLARRYRGGSEPLADLEQVARLGLVKVVDRYSPDRGSFTGYALQTITGELKRHLRDRSWAVHVPRAMQELAMAVVRHEADLTRELGRRPTDEETAQRAGIATGDLDQARMTASSYRSVSLDMPLGQDGRAFGELFGDVDPSLEKVADQLTVADLVAALPGRERHVVISAFYGGATQADIAAQLGVSQMQISRIQSRALAWMREGLLTDRVPRWPTAFGLPEETFELRTALVAPGRLEIHISGEVDRDNAGRLRTALLELVCRQPAGQQVTLQLGGVPLLAAAGVRVLLAVYEAARARDVTVTATGLNPLVRKIAAATGLAPMLAPENPH